MGIEHLRVLLSEEKEEGETGWTAPMKSSFPTRLCKQNEQSRISCVPKCCVCSSWAEPRTRPLWRACTRRKTTMRLDTNLALKPTSSSQKSDRSVKCVHCSMFSWQRRMHCLLSTTVTAQIVSEGTRALTEHVTRREPLIGCWLQ